MYMLYLLSKAITIIFLVFVRMLFPRGGRDVKQCFVMWLVNGKKDEMTKKIEFRVVTYIVLVKETLDLVFIANDLKAF